MILFSLFERFCIRHRLGLRLSGDLYLYIDDIKICIFDEPQRQYRQTYYGYIYFSKRKYCSIKYLTKQGLERLYEQLLDDDRRYDKSNV